VDIEFHYCITYLIAARAGYAPSEAVIIAHAAQSVDDNHIPIRVVDNEGRPYENEISQTFDILHAHEDERIYPVFHFIPGEPRAPSARRRDGIEHPMMTTPDSALANRMLDAAIASQDLYRIGASSHGYVDTWAHQNFVGMRDAVNEFASSPWGKVEQRILAVGHAHARHYPDWPALIWHDSRLVESTVDNRVRFLEAAKALYRKLARARNSRLAAEELEVHASTLARDLDRDIGPRDDRNERSAARCDAYRARSNAVEYGGTPMPAYVMGQWFDEAFEEPRSTVRARLENVLTNGKFGALGKFLGDWLAVNNRLLVHWKDPSPEGYGSTHWYRFQEAGKAHIEECHGILREHHQSQ
jgi:hypothetical protein